MLIITNVLFSKRKKKKQRNCNEIYQQSCKRLKESEKICVKETKRINFKLKLLV